MLDALAARRTVEGRVAIVVAHPDDETIAAGASLRLMPELLLVHVTDGAPRRLDDARRAGFAAPAAYAAARERELQAALAIAGVRPARARLGIPDQDAVLHLRTIADALHHTLEQQGIQRVLTHAYEGGHPDHDATAWAAREAAGRLGIPVFEFAGYHAAPGHMTVQRFLPGPSATFVSLDGSETGRKRAMLDCFATQSEILSRFDASLEAYRPAPDVDFAAPPHAGLLNYEHWGWEMTGRKWRALAPEAAGTGRAACAA